MKNKMEPLSHSLLVAGALSFLTASGAHASGVSLVAGANSSTSTQTSATQTLFQTANIKQSSGWGYSFGGLAAYDLTPTLAIEGGLIYSHERINVTYGGPTFMGPFYVTFNYLQVPLLLRYQLLPQFLSVGAGGYYAHTIGTVTTVSSVPGISSGTASVGSSGTSTSDFGAVFSIRAGAPINPGISAFIDARYMLGIMNTNTDGNSNDNSSNRQMQFLAGLSFDLDTPRSAPDSSSPSSQGSAADKTAQPATK